MAQYLGTSTVLAGPPIFSSLRCIGFHRIHVIYYCSPCTKRGRFLTTYHRLIARSVDHDQTLPLLVAKRKMLSKRDAVDETPLINHGENCDYDIDSTTVQVQSSSSETTPRTPEAKLSLLNRGLFMIYLNYIFLAFLDMGHFTLLPLFYSTSIPSGGLGLDPSKIGIVMGCFGFVNAIVQARYLGPSIRKFGARKVYIICFPSLFGCFALYPIMKHLTQGFGGVNSLVIICMMIQLSLQMLVFSSSGTCIYILLNLSSSNLVWKVLCKLSWHSMCLLVVVWARLLALLRCLRLQWEHWLPPLSLHYIRYLHSGSLQVAIWCFIS